MWNKQRVFRAYCPFKETSFTILLSDHPKYSSELADAQMLCLSFFSHPPSRNKGKKKEWEQWNKRTCDCVIRSCVQSQIPLCWMTDWLLAGCIKNHFFFLFQSFFPVPGVLTATGGLRGRGGGIGCQLIASLRGDYVLIEKTTDNYGSQDGNARERLPNRHGGRVGPGLIITTETDPPPSPQQPF